MMRLRPTGPSASRPIRPALSRRLRRVIPAAVWAACYFLPIAALAQDTGGAHDNPFIRAPLPAPPTLPNLPRLPGADTLPGTLSKPPAEPAVPTGVLVGLVGINNHTALLSITEDGVTRLRTVANGGTFYIKGRKYRLAVDGLNVRVSRNKDVVWDMDLQGLPVIQR